MYFCITQLHYLALLALGARSVIHVWVGFWTRLVALIKNHRVENDWSVVGMEDTSDQEEDRSTNKGEVVVDDYSLGRTVADMKVKNLFQCLSNVFGEYGRHVGDTILGVCAFLKMVFWPILTVAYVASVRQVYLSYTSPCNRLDSQFYKIAEAYEVLTDIDYSVERSYWQEHSREINTADFLVRFYAIHVACCIGT